MIVIIGKVRQIGEVRSYDSTDSAGRPVQTRYQEMLVGSGSLSANITLTNQTCDDVAQQGIQVGSNVCAEVTLRTSKMGGTEGRPEWYKNNVYCDTIMKMG